MGMQIPTPGGVLGSGSHERVVDALIGLMWADLDPSSGGEVYYQGDASSFVASYETVAYCCGTDTPNNTFQATFTPDGAILRVQGPAGGRLAAAVDRLRERR